MSYRCQSFVSALLVGFSVLSSQAFYEERFISAPGVQPSVHSSSILELNNGDLLACWYGGAREGASDVRIYCSHRQVGADQWAAPLVAVDRQERAKGAIIKNDTIGNPVLFKGVGNEVWMVYAARPFGGWLMTHIDYKLSTDGGFTWSASKRLVHHYGHLPRIKPLEIDATHVLLPLYKEWPARGYSAYIEISAGKIKMLSRQFMPKFNHLQPSFVRINNEIHAYLRNKKTHTVLTSVFDFNNKKWSSVRQIPELPNPNASVDSVARNSNEVLLVYNNSANGRTPLSLAITGDGVHFQRFFDVEAEPNKEYSYPAFIRTENGVYHLTYTYLRQGIKQVSFDEAWLAEKLSGH